MERPEKAAALQNHITASMEFDKKHTDSAESSGANIQHWLQQKKLTAKHKNFIPTIKQQW